MVIYGSVNYGNYKEGRKNIMYFFMYDKMKVIKEKERNCEMIEIGKGNVVNK